LCGYIFVGRRKIVARKIWFFIHFPFSRWVAGGGRRRRIRDQRVGEVHPVGLGEEERPRPTSPSTTASKPSDGNPIFPSSPATYSSHEYYLKYPFLQKDYGILSEQVFFFVKRQ
jgi:hypothetical protein